MTPFEQARIQLTELGERWQANNWYKSLVENAPGPIAHEIQAFAHIASTGDSGGMLFQARDMVETFLKFSTLAMACELIADGSESQISESRQRLLGPPKSLGTWHSDATWFAKQIPQLETPVTYKIAELLRDKEWLKLLASFVATRNREIGHGAYRFDPLERFGDLKEITEGSNGIAALIAGLGPLEWPTLQLELAGGDTVPLTGATAIRNHHDQYAPDGTHSVEPYACWLESGGRRINLAPYVMARRCEKCQHQDVFLFDAAILKKQETFHFDVIDYVQGHKYRLYDSNFDQETESVIAELAEKHVKAVQRGLTDADTLSELDQAISAVTRYVTPDYLMEPLIEQITTKESSVTWLRAPAHIGKSLFCRAIADRNSGQQNGSSSFDEMLSDRVSDLRVAGIFIQRHWRADFKLFANRLREELRAALNIAVDYASDIPVLTPDAKDPVGMFVDMIERARQVNLSASDSPLLIVIDGLDELTDTPEAIQLLDYLPTQNQLPGGCHLFLTSRRPGDDDCPAWIGNRLEPRLQGASTWI